MGLGKAEQRSWLQNISSLVVGASEQNNTIDYLFPTKGPS